MSASGQNGIPDRFPVRPGGQRRREARDLLFAVFAQDPQVERAVGAPGVVLGAGDHLRFERRHTTRRAGAFVDALGDLERAAADEAWFAGADHGVRRRLRGVGPARRRADQRRGRARAELQRELAERLLRVCSGTSSTSCPVTGFGSILPATLTMIPRSGSFATTYSASSDPPGCSASPNSGRCHTAWRYRPRRGSFRRATAFRFRSSRSSIPAGSLRPAARTVVSDSYCAGVHAPRPAASDGVRRDALGQRDRRVLQVRGRDRVRVFPRLRDDQRDIQAGRRFRGAGRRAALRSTVRTARVRIRRSDRPGRSLRRLSGLRYQAVPPTSTASIVAVNGPQLVGFDRNGLTGMSASWGPPNSLRHDRGGGSAS